MNAKKVQLVENFHDLLQQNQKSFALYVNKGLNAEDVVLLRRHSKKNNLTVRIIKNKLAKIALKTLNCPEKTMNHLKNNLFFVLSDDPVKCASLSSQISEIKDKIELVCLSDQKSCVDENLSSIARLGSKDAVVGSITAISVFPVIKLIKTIELAAAQKGA